MHINLDLAQSAIFNDDPNDGHCLYCLTISSLLSHNYQVDQRGVAAVSGPACLTRVLTPAAMLI